MATLERKVVDFKIHNISEEKFQELKDAGQIDPNAVYCTPDDTKERLDALEEHADTLEERADVLEGRADTLEERADVLEGRAGVLEERADTLEERADTLEERADTLSQQKANDSDVVHKTGDETIAGIKTFEKVINTNDTVLMRRTVDNSYGEWFGGTAYNKGGYFRADGMDNQDSVDNPGGFICAAYSKENDLIYQLRGQADGRLIWRGYDVVTTQGSNDYVVETSLVAHSNGLTWYRKYKSWWVEQGGVITGINPHVTFPIPMANLNYAWIVSNFNQYAGERDVRLDVYNRSVTGMTITNTTSGNATNNQTVTWEIKGYRSA